MVETGVMLTCSPASQKDIFSVVEFEITVYTGLPGDGCEVDMRNDHLNYPRKQVHSCA